MFRVSLTKRMRVRAENRRFDVLTDQLGRSCRLFFDKAEHGPAAQVVFQPQPRAIALKSRLGSTDTQCEALHGRWHVSRASFSA
jgi:hypothetical protein